VSAVPERVSQHDEAYLDRMPRWKKDPYAFWREMLAIPCFDGDEFLTDDQKLLVDSYMKNHRTACTSGNSTGKTFVHALIVLHFLALWEDSIVITTGASEEVVSNLWDEIRRLYNGARYPLGGQLVDLELRFGPKWYARGISTNNMTRLQGKHAGRVLFLIEEAVGVEPWVFEAGEGNAVGEEDRILASANPTDATCAFYDELQKDGKWNVVEISCLNHPNVVTGRNLISGACTRRFVEDMLRNYGEDHPVYKARVLGKWSRELGRLFPDWSAARHTYDPRLVRIQPWWTHWIAGDWGFRHNSAFYFFALDPVDSTIYVYDELVVNGLVAAQLGNDVGALANPGIQRGVVQEFQNVYLAHDAFGHQGETARTRAELFSEAAAEWGLPKAVPAPRDRVSGFNLITALLRNDGLKVSLVCSNLIKKMPLAMRDPKRPEDGLKCEGDDEIDGLYKGVLARPTEAEMPAAVKIAQQITAVDPHGIAMQSRILASRERGDGAEVFSLRGRRYAGR
jgi:hypothetical protein